MSGDVAFKAWMFFAALWTVVLVIYGYNAWSDYTSDAMTAASVEAVCTHQTRPAWCSGWMGRGWQDPEETDEVEPADPFNLWAVGTALIVPIGLAGLLAFSVS